MLTEIKYKINITYFRIYLIDGSKILSTKLFSYVKILKLENCFNILSWKRLRWSKIFVDILCFNKKKYD